MKVYELLATRDSWVKCSWRTSDGRRCLYSAIATVYGRDELTSCMARVVPAIALLYPSRSWRRSALLESEPMFLERAKSYVVEFNDNRATTHEDVLRVCKVADV